MIERTFTLEELKELVNRYENEEELRDNAANIAKQLINLLEELEEEKEKGYSIIEREDHKNEYE